MSSWKSIPHTSTSPRNGEAGADSQISWRMPWPFSSARKKDSSGRRLGCTTTAASVGSLLLASPVQDMLVSCKIELLPLHAALAVVHSGLTGARASDVFPSAISFRAALNTSASTAR